MKVSLLIQKAASASSSSLLKILPEVKEAISLGKPIVALESTILAHGLPYPENISLAESISQIVRSKGVVPATIAIRNGQCCIGLSKDEVKDLALAGMEHRATKCSTRDMPLILSKHHNERIVGDDGDSDRLDQWGATTVASTMRLAHLAGIQTFVTGGTGGVHRGGEHTMDISADLPELSRTPVIVVSAGVKSILDIKRTLETLETLGVPTMSYQTDEFPAFFSPTSGIPTPHRVNSPQEVAGAFLASRSLGLPNGMLVAVPNNDPAGESVEIAIQETLEKVDRLGIEGRDVTPFILKHVAEKTGGDSLNSNISLVKRNANVGADIAVAISKQAQLNASMNKDRVFLNGTNDYDPPKSSSSRVLVVGGAVIDLVAKPKEGTDLIAGTSNPGNCSESDGGVGRNIAEVLGRLGANPILFSVVGSDGRGSALLQRMEEECSIQDVKENVIVKEGLNTATYLAVLNEYGDLHTAIADMDILQAIPVPNKEAISSSEMIILDANPPIQKLVDIAHAAYCSGVRVLFEPTSVPKATAVSDCKNFLSSVSHAFPNKDELFAMSRLEGVVNATSDNGIDDDLSEDDWDSIKKASLDVIGKMRTDSAHLIVTLGKNGVLLVSKIESKTPTFNHFAAKEGVDVVNSTGAGDTLVGAFAKALLDGENETRATELGMDAAVKSLGCGGRAICTTLGR